MGDTRSLDYSSYERYKVKASGFIGLCLAGMGLRQPP